MHTIPASGRRQHAYRVGQVVQVRSAEEILATLDENGECDSLPFMPEMLKYCNQRLTVDKVAHKLCDTVTQSGMRRMNDAVHLTGARCDGSAHGGCQAMCLIYWKTAWLKPVDEGSADDVSAMELLGKLVMEASRGEPAEDGAEVFRCQATEMPRAAPQPLPVRDFGQYLLDVRSGNVGTRWALRALLVALFNRVQDLSSRHLPRWLRFRQGRRWGFLSGTAMQTPTERTDLQPGELVRIRSKREIMKTLNPDLLNRGLGFDAEMSRFCGREARVARRIDHIIDEKTGRMLYMRNPCIVLEGVVCEGAYSVNCPRSITAYWREIWLERAAERSLPATTTAVADGAGEGAPRTTVA